MYSATLNLVHNIHLQQVHLPIPTQLLDSHHKLLWVAAHTLFGYNPLIRDYFLDSFISKIITGTYNNFFRIFDRQMNNDYCYEASRDMSTLGQILRHKRVVPTGRKRKDEVAVESLDYTRKILHAAWHPRDNILAIAATNNLYLFHEQQP